MGQPGWHPAREFSIQEWVFCAILLHMLVDHSISKSYICTFVVKKKGAAWGFDRAMTGCPKGEKWTSRTVVKIRVSVYVEYICIDRDLPAF